MNMFIPNPTRRIDRILLLICVSTAIAAGCVPNTPTGNNPPAVNAGADQVVNAGAGVTLDGSESSDPDGDTISFSWSQTLGTSVSLSSTSASIVTFTAPANGTTLVFELAVSDGQSDAVGTVRVSVHPDDASAQVVEVSQRSIMDDPAVNGAPETHWSLTPLPETPPPSGDPDENEEEGDGAPEHISDVKFAPLVEIQLSPGATHDVDRELGGPSDLSGSVRWLGTPSPLEVTLSLDGSRLATGSSYSLAVDRGGSTVAARTTTGGHATLSVTNTSGAAVTVRIVFGALAL